MNTIHLICNAHIDPAWQWEWEEGAAEAVSTFRTAADFCEEFDDFIFCHNEVILYEWVEEFEPQLFKRIQKLVKQGKWHIMGGWYLQPDCNMPSGEAFVRQILLGRTYFKEKFDKYPTTAINFDPFGHSRGLVQIMTRSGFDSYLFCRPDNHDCPLPSELFEWEGFDGSKITTLRSWELYNSPKGKADHKIQKFIDSAPPYKSGLLLWGIGNHGGGPSHEDIKKIKKVIKKRKDINIKHSTPENYFNVVKKQKKILPTVSKSLNPWAVGCYTSQVLIKQLNRRLENELFATEKMITSAWVQGLLKDYPQIELRQVMRDMAIVQFHDILPGTGIEAVEENSIRLAYHGLEKLSRLKARAFFALSSGQKKTKKNSIPLLVYNPHPFTIESNIECEYQLEQALPIKEGFTVSKVYCNGQILPTQFEKERSSLEMDWRKRVIFNATLKPSQMNRFDCKLIRIKKHPKPVFKVINNKYRFKTDKLELIINTKTGLIDSYKVANKDILKPFAFEPLVMKDNEDPWGMLQNKFDKLIGKFSLLSETKSAKFSGVKAKTLAPVRVIEDGEVRTIVEAVLGYGNSFICQHYILPKRGTQVAIKTHVIWNEKDKLLKLNIPMNATNPKMLGQVAYGTEELEINKNEVVAQKWIAVVDGETTTTLINNGVYGYDFCEGSLRPTLLRSPAYCAHPIMEQPHIIPQDRFLPRIDTGYRTFNFFLNAGETTDRLNKIGREALVIAEKPMALSFYPCSSGKKPKRLVELSDNVVEFNVAKKADNNNNIIIRLFEPTGQTRKTTISIPFLKLKKTITLNRFEIKTMEINPKKKTIIEVSIDEKKL